MFGVRLTVTYDGTEFAGWQRQPGQRTVESTLALAIEVLAGAACEVRGASRTDSGVHALGQVAAFDSPREIPSHGWERGLNGYLPADVAIRRAEPCAAGYHPRYDALAKTYRYLLHLGPARDPLLRHHSWHLGPTRARPLGGKPTRAEDWLDVEAMHAAAAQLVGEHDFRAFKTSRDPRSNSVRTLTRVDVLEHFAGREDVLAIEIRGTAFLHNMVRILVGTLVDVGRERLEPKDVAGLLDGAERDEAGETAPAHGLCLVEIELGREGP